MKYIYISAYIFIEEKKEKKYFKTKITKSDYNYFKNEIVCANFTTIYNDFKKYNVTCKIL